VGPVADAGGWLVVPLYAILAMQKPRPGVRPSISIGFGCLSSAGQKDRRFAFRLPRLIM
jgi:hypothetical protein